MNSTLKTDMIYHISAATRAIGRIEGVIDSLDGLRHSYNNDEDEAVKEYVLKCAEAAGKALDAMCEVLSKEKTPDCLPGSYLNNNPFDNIALLHGEVKCDSTTGENGAKLNV